MPTHQLLWLQPPPDSENKRTQLFPYSIHESPLEKLIVAQPVKKISVFCGTRKSVTVFTRGPPLPVHTLLPSAVKLQLNTILLSTAWSSELSPYLLTYLLTPWSRVLLQKLTSKLFDLPVNVLKAGVYWNCTHAFFPHELLIKIADTCLSAVNEITRM